MLIKTIKKYIINNKILVMFIIIIVFAIFALLELNKIEKRIRSLDDEIYYLKRDIENKLEDLESQIYSLED